MSRKSGDNKTREQTAAPSSKDVKNKLTVNTRISLDTAKKPATNAETQSTSSASIADEKQIVDPSAIKGKDGKKTPSPPSSAPPDRKKTPSPPSAEDAGKKTPSPPSSAPPDRKKTPSPPSAEDTGKKTPSPSSLENAGKKTPSPKSGSIETSSASSFATFPQSPSSSSNKKNAGTSGLKGNGGSGWSLFGRHPSGAEVKRPARPSSFDSANSTNSSSTSKQKRNTDPGTNPLRRLVDIWRKKTPPSSDTLSNADESDEFAHRKSNVRVSNPQEYKSNEPIYEFSSNLLLTMDAFIIANFNKMETSSGSGLSKISRIFKNINESNIEDLYRFHIEVIPEKSIIEMTLQVLDVDAEVGVDVTLKVDDPIIIKKVQWLSKIDRDYKNILFILDQNRSAQKPSIAVFIFEPESNVVQEIYLDQDSPFWAILNPAFISGNPKDVDENNLRKLLMTKPLSPTHPGIIEMLANAFEVLACCRYTKHTLNFNHDDGLIGNCEGNASTSSAFEIIEDNVTIMGSNVINAYSETIMSYLKLKHRRANVAKFSVEQEEEERDIKLTWPSKVNKPGDILLIYNQANKIWTLSYFVKPGECKECKMISPDSSYDDMTDDLVCEILNKIKMNKFNWVSGEAERSDKHYNPVSGIRTPPDYICDLILEFCTSYLKLFIEFGKDNAAKFSQGLRKSHYFTDPPGSLATNNSEKSPEPKTGTLSPSLGGSDS